MVPAAPREPEPRRLPSSAPPAPELSALRRVPGPGRQPRPEEAWRGPATRGSPELRLLGEVAAR